MLTNLVRVLFAVAGLYDFVIGAGFLFVGAAIFDSAGVPHPNHWAYIQFVCLLLMIFGVMFFAIAYDPAGNRNLIPFGMLLKAAYAGLVAYYWATSGCATLFKPFAIVDGIMLILFLLAYLQLRRPSAEQVAPT
jgi:hypothetical protein